MGVETLDRIALQGGRSPRSEVADILAHRDIAGVVATEFADPVDVDAEADAPRCRRVAEVVKSTARDLGSPDHQENVSDDEIANVERSPASLTEDEV